MNPSRSFEFDPVNPETHKINAIKLVREFTMAAFPGFPAGLKASKDFVEVLVMDGAQLKKERDWNNAVRIALLALPRESRDMAFMQFAQIKYPHLLKRYPLGSDHSDMGWLDSQLSVAV